MKRHRAVPIAVLIGLTGLVSASRVAAQERFIHEDHGSIVCADCHANGRATSAANGAWCASCHHVEVAVTECERCHDTGELIPEPGRTLVTFNLSVGEPRTRSLTFDHEPHGDLGCGECHSGGAELVILRDCASCHIEHHQAGSRCTACHSEPPVTAHPEEVHLDLAGCGAAGCHVSEGLDYAAMADPRNLCLSCHFAQIDHEPGPPCAECHIPEDPARRRSPRP